MILSGFGKKLIALPGLSSLLTLIGILPVANGGTGRASHTAYAVICGGTTTTAAQQSIAAVGSSGDILTSNGAGALPTFQTPAAGVSAASQSDQETGTSTTTYVSPGRQQFHQSAAKFWAKVAGAGTLTSSYNVTSVTDSGTGNMTVNIATDFSSSDWCCIFSLAATPDVATPYINYLGYVTAQAAGTVTIGSYAFRLETASLGSQSVNASDPTTYFVAGFGDQ